MNISTVAILFFGTSLGMAQAAQAGDLEPAASIAEAETNVSVEVEFVAFANWEIGDQYRIDYTATRTTLLDGVQSTGKAWALINTRVEEKSLGGYVVSWTNMDVGLENYAEGAGVMGKEVEAILADMRKNLRTEILTDLTGYPTGIRNLDEMVSHMNAVAENFLAKLQLDPAKENIIRSTLEQATDPRTLEDFVLGHAYLVYGLMGDSYRGGQVRVRDIALSFPFGGPPIPTKLHVLLRKADEQKGLAWIVAQSVPDPVLLNKALGEWETRTALSQGQPAPEPSQIPKLYVQDTTEYVYDSKMRLPREVTSEYFIRVEGSTDIEINRQTYRITPEN